MKVLNPGKKYKELSILTDIPVWFLFAIFITTVFTISCTEADKFTIGDNFVESQTNLKIIDTFKIDLSTVLLDSIATSGTGVALVGGYEDEEFGTIGSESYFELAYRTFDDVEDLAIFDSASFVMVYSGYSYGDTTSLMKISINQLTESIDLDGNSYLYSNSAFDYSQVPLGTRLFYPEPHSSDTSLSIQVNDFGNKIFNLIIDQDKNLATSDLFLDYLKGFVITSGSSDNRAVVGFLADESHLFLKIYYHIDQETSSEDHEISIPFGASNKQFNSIQYDFTNTELDNIKSDNNEVSSDETGNKAYLQALVGLLPKINFPTLQNVLLENNWKILKAELIFEPVKTSYDLFPLPEKLYFYETDKLNRLNAVLKDANGDALITSFTLDDLYKEETYYTFDITTFINEEFTDSYFDYEHGLLIALNGTELKSTLERMVIEGKKPPIKLKIYYLSY